MLFNSYIFIFMFLPITLLLYFGFNKIKKYEIAKLVLVIASLYFYAYFNVKYLFIIVASILINYLFNRIFRKLKNKNFRRILLIIGVAFNIGMIFYYKYYDFVISTINSLASTNFNLINVMLPLGISFFTFQQMAYVIDSYKGEVKDYTLLDYSLFVTFFPQLIAGPITLYSEMIPQFEDEKNKNFNSENFSKGLLAFSFGLAKKVLIADTFAIVANYVFANPTDTNSTNLILGMLSYTFQIYFDFSGYCDMALGLGYMFNIKLPINFNSPYKSHSVVEFWKRWHMTLTRFFTKYIYIPLGGSRKGKIRTYINVFIVFLASGIWHGANFTFILWGILHGIASILNRIFKNVIEKTNEVFNWICTFLFINFTWVIFRADSISDALNIIKHILKLNFGPINSNILDAFTLPEFTMITDLLGRKAWIAENYNTLYLLIFFTFAFFAILCMKNTQERVEEFKPSTRNAIISAVLLVMSIISLSGVSTFLYFNF